MDGTAHPFYINGNMSPNKSLYIYEMGQGMSLAGNDWTHISHHKTVGMGVKFQNKIMQFLCQALHFGEKSVNIEPS